MLVYLHVPFCRARCRYCAFHSEPLNAAPGKNGSLKMRAYVNTLHMEIARWGDELAARDAPRDVESIFFGGGTPSLLAPSTVAATLDRLRRAFTIRPDAEITLEGNPESLSDRNAIRAYIHAGINRFSLGVQSLDDAKLRQLGRVHTAAEAINAMRRLREAGCANLNLDFIWGLPGQKVSQWLREVKSLCELRPEHVSAYGLTLEPDTPLQQDCASGLTHLPQERELALMYMQGAELLEEAGLVQYEVSNFARMGFQCRHNMGYWEGKDYLGFGPSASSTYNGKRWTSPADFTAWGRAVTTGPLADGAELLDPRTQVLELIMLRLRTTRGLRLKDYRELVGRDFTDDHRRLVEALHKNKLIRILNGHLRLTRQGMLVSNSILANLFEITKTITLEPELAAIRPKPKIFGDSARLARSFEA